jgi:hypothetical protein
LSVSRSFSIVTSGMGWPSRLDQTHECGKNDHVDRQQTIAKSCCNAP